MPHNIVIRSHWVPGIQQKDLLIRLQCRLHDACEDNGYDRLFQLVRDLKFSLHSRWYWSTDKSEHNAGLLDPGKIVFMTAAPGRSSLRRRNMDKEAGTCSGKSLQSQCIHLVIAGRIRYENP
jgi:hypothetical protein